MLTGEDASYIAAIVLAVVGCVYYELCHAKTLLRHKHTYSWDIKRPRLFFLAVVISLLFLTYLGVSVHGLSR